MTIAEARERLNDLDEAVRYQALAELLAACRTGEVACPPTAELVNLHCHTFFSYNGYGHSPTSLAWLARESGWRALGTVDFDVLDGVEETLSACDCVGVRAAAGIETRAYLPEFAAYEINSPGEPGVFYHIGMGFVSRTAPSPADRVLADMRQRAARRNREMVSRINAYLDPVMIDYDREVLPLTPSGNATERHILIAYDAAARQRFPERDALVAFWAARLNMDPAAVDRFLGDKPFPHDTIRSKLMKQGGVGYVPPGPETFPPFETVNRAIIACGAVPVCGWLDGTSSGEQRMDELLALLTERGVGAVNIVPDRNWNLPDPKARAIKVRELYRIVDLARSLDLPVLAGTEMNKAGQPLMDDFAAEPMRPLHADFLRGADFIYGHTVMQRALGWGYGSAWAQKHLPRRSERNAFYIAVGRLAEPGPETVARLARLGASPQTPEAMVSHLERWG